MSHRTLATMLVFLLAGIPLPARAADAPNLLPLGVVTQASGAHFKAAKVSAGATIYDGDGLSTEAEGALQFRGSAAVFYLPGSSGVTLHGLPMGTQAQLQTGTVVRCPSCDNVLMVFVTIHDRTCVDLMGLASLG